jgi:hypothetical protein
MKAEEIFEKSVAVMKQLLTPQGVSAALARARGRQEEENLDLLLRERENINELVRKVVDAKGSQQAIAGASERLTDAMVIRYIRNRDIFMKTFPRGIEEVDPEPVSLWASIMVSPRDEDEGG